MAEAAIHFDGASTPRDVLYFSNVLPGGVGGSALDQTHETWIKSSTSGIGVQMMSIYGRFGTGGSIGISDAGTFIFLKGGSSSDTAINSGVVITDGAGHLVIASYLASDNKVRFYVDGVLVNTSAILGSWSACDDFFLNPHIGSDIGGGASLNLGTLDETRYYTTFLDQAAVDARWNGGNGLSGPDNSPGLLYGMHWDETPNPYGPGSVDLGNGTIRGDLTYVASLLNNAPSGPSVAVLSGSFFGSY